MFDPFEQKQVGPAMTPEQTAFVERNFTAYIPNEVVLDKILEDCPKPTLKLLEPPKLDASLLALLNSDSLKPAKFSDKTFARLQMKTADVLGPLGALWTKLDDVRREGEEEVDISELLRLAEKSVMLVGQIFVYATHQRRHGILTRILKEPSSATETLKENCKIQGKLEEDYLRPTYSEHGGGFESGVHRHPNTVDRTTVAKFLGGGGGKQATGRDRENVGKRGNQGSDTRKGPVSEPSFPQAKERRGSEASVQLEESECICEIRTLQDGGHTNVSEHPGEGRLDDEGGSKRRVFLCSVVRDTEKALQVQMEKPAVRISGAPIWDGISTESVHKITEASDEHSEAHGTQDHNFPGRSVRVQQRQVSTSERQGHGSQVVPDITGYDKLEQIVFDTGKDIGIFGVDHSFPENVTVAPDRESPRNKGAL